MMVNPRSTPWQLSLLTISVVSVTGGCALLVPASRDPIELATQEQKESACDASALDPELEGRSAILSVGPAYSSIPSKAGYDTHLLGAELRYRPLPGLTTERLERALRCHAVRLTLARTIPPDDPFVLPNAWVKIKVEAAETSFVVRATSTEATEAKEILARATSFAKN
ncbi:hypothetical protein AKJ09_08796 [Labilithrix luteola]|uniref:Lipoprotein n=1 Tax=Labilithrix luteola TaxID=1391654 RepID=A0A0K1Q8R6_9BACT|nr:hypothetical protein [Labilithrix luteola]AKV02133.1 hypothetical protein AKJ09_08796 [Labilithrix luteola]